MGIEIFSASAMRVSVTILLRIREQSLGPVERFPKPPAAVSMEPFA
jgi:hypothetical protein